MDTSINASNNQGKITKKRYALRVKGAGMNDDINDYETAAQIMKSQFILDRMRKLGEAIKDAEKKYVEAPHESAAEQAAAERWVNLLRVENILKETHPEIIW